MKRLSLVVWLLVLCWAGVALAGSREHARLREQHQKELLVAKADPKKAFAEWKAKHGKSYANGDLLGADARFRHWQDNLDYALKYNEQHKSHWIGLNGLADLSQEEFKQRYVLGGGRFLQRRQRRGGNGGALVAGFAHGALDAAGLPQSIDWRQKGAVSEVKNQMACGSCWAFSTTGSIEGINKLVTGELVSLSEQFLVDCDTSKDKGCAGGLMDFAFDFVQENGGIEYEEDYPYTGQDGECTADSNRRVVTIDGYQDVPPNDEIALKKAVSRQPVSVAIQADQRAFQLYVGGVFDDKECGTALDHGVLVIGYGQQDSPSPDDDGDDGGGGGGDPLALETFRNYWIVKNSWGNGWGDGGFINIRMGRGKSGLCGIAMAPSYPLKTGPNPQPQPQPGPPAPAPAPGPEPGPGPPPPPPEPEPVSCDLTHECPPENTCCCLRDIGGFCFSWGCCPMPKATCCGDHQHCCPSNLPVCDTDSGRCLPPTGLSAAPVPWATKLPARRKASPAGLAAGGGFSSKGGRGGRRFIRPDGALPAAA